MGHDKNINNITIQYKDNKALLYKNLYYILEMHLYKPRSRYGPMKTCAFVTAIKIHIYIHTHHMYKYCNNAIPSPGASSSCLKQMRQTQIMSQLQKAPRDDAQ